MLRAAVALPTPVFVALWPWVRGVARMDELERRVELEALVLRFVSIVFATLGLLDRRALTLDPNDFSLLHNLVDDADAVLHRPLACPTAAPVKNRLKVLLRAERDWSQADLAGAARRVAPDR